MMPCVTLCYTGVLAGWRLSSTHIKHRGTFITTRASDCSITTAMTKLSQEPFEPTMWKEDLKSGCHQALQGCLADGYLHAGHSPTKCTENVTSKTFWKLNENQACQVAYQPPSSPSRYSTLELGNCVAHWLKHNPTAHSNSLRNINTRRLSWTSSLLLLCTIYVCYNPPLLQVQVCNTALCSWAFLCGVDGMLSSPHCTHKHCTSTSYPTDASKGQKQSVESQSLGESSRIYKARDAGGSVAWKVFQGSSWL